MTVVEAVKAHALSHYNKGGWDIIVETFEDAELAEAIGQVQSTAAAIRKIARIAKLLDEQRRSVMNEVF